MSAVAAVTSRIQLYASVAIPTMHPAVIAKMTSTIDDISNGRFGVNIVSGWNKFEYLQMGLWRGDEYFSYRYDYAAEYLEVLRKLWRTGRTSHDGRFFKLNDCKSLPQPSRTIPIVCAGQSDRGIQFTAEHADFSFLGGQDDSLADLARLNQKLQAAARPHGKTVGSYVLLTVIVEETDEAAFALRDHFIETSDRAALQEWSGNAGQDFSAPPTRISRSRPSWPSPMSQGRTPPWRPTWMAWSKAASPASASFSPTTKTTCRRSSTMSCRCASIRARSWWPEDRQHGYARKAAVAAGSTLPSSSSATL